MNSVVCKGYTLKESIKNALNPSLYNSSLKSVLYSPHRGLRNHSIVIIQNFVGILGIFLFWGRGGDVEQGVFSEYELVV